MVRTWTFGRSDESIPKSGDSMKVKVKMKMKKKEEEEKEKEEGEQCALS